MSDLAVPEMAWEERAAQNGQHEDKEHHNEQQIRNTGQTVKQGGNSEFKTSVSGKQSQGSQDSHHSKGLDESQIDVDEDDRDRSWQHNHEIKNIPRVSNVGISSVENEPESENFGKHFANEETGHQVIDIGQHHCLGAVGVVQRRLQGKEEGRDDNQENDHTLEPLVGLDEVAGQPEWIRWGQQP